MDVTLSRLANAEFRFDSSNPIAAHTVDELHGHAALTTGSGERIMVALEAGNGPGDGFSVTVDGEVVIHGDSGRGLLNGAYWLLERLGVLWVRPGAEGVRYVPGGTLGPGTYDEQPLFPRRTLILGNDALHDDWREWMTFASRNRLNSLFFHDTPPSVLDRADEVRPATAEGIAADRRGWLFERWDLDGESIRAEAVKRGMELQFGGHHLAALLRRSFFEEHADWFTLRGGARDSRYNLCTSSKGAVDEVRRRAGEFFTRFGGARVYHLWADDILGGGWCECDECAALTPSDQALRATNILAEVLAEVAPGAEVAHLAYHDTIAPPRTVAPGPNVTALYAPRNRNYGFAIDDPACPKNSVEHLGELRGLAQTFKGHPGALAAFEYYSDAILYKWLDPPNLRVLPADAAAYARMGVADFGDLAVSPRPWWGPTWHAWWFARCAWNQAIDAESELTRFCAASFGTDAEAFALVYRAFDEGYRLLLDLGQLERGPRHDVLDFSDNPREALRAKAQQLQEALATMNGAVTMLPLLPDVDALGSARREDIAVELAFANHITSRIAAWDAALDGHRAEAREHLELANLHLRALNDWDATHTPAAYANLSRGMLRAARWHTDQVAALIADGA